MARDTQGSRRAWQSITMIPFKNSKYTPTIITVAIEKVSDRMVRERLSKVLQTPI
jgi:hypothetical protein